MFYDDSITESVADSIHRVLSRSAATAMIRLAGTGQVQTLLSGVSADSSGQHFLVISRQNMEFINKVSIRKLKCIITKYSSIQVQQPTRRG